MQVGMVAMVSLALTVQETSGSEIAPYRVSLDSDHLLSFFLFFSWCVDTLDTLLVGPSFLDDFLP
jgi:hypothetical protein